MPRRTGKTKGNVVLELAIVVPILFMLGIAGIEMARAIRTLQLALSLSKNMAAAAYRQCVVDPKQTAGSSLATTHKPLFHPATCLGEVRSNLLTALTNTVPDASFVISMYSNTGGSARRDGIVTQGSKPSKFDTSKFNGATSTTGSPNSPGDPGSLANALRDYEVLVVAEVYVPYEPLWGKFFIMTLFDPGSVYGVTVL